MSTTESKRLNRPPNPSPKQILSIMTPGEPYTTGDLLEMYSGETSRWTIQRRLEQLHELNEVKKKKHNSNRVTWWSPVNEG